MKFKISDRVRVLPPPPGFSWRYHEVGAVGIVAAVDSYIGPDLGQSYVLDITPPGRTICERCLELVPPEQSKEQLGDWELCPWRPEPVRLQSGGWEWVRQVAADHGHDLPLEPPSNWGAAFQGQTTDNFKE